MIKSSSIVGHVIEKLLDLQPNEDLMVRLQLVEEATGLLLMFPGGNEFLDIMHRPFRQDYKINIQKTCKYS